MTHRAQRALLLVALLVACGDGTPSAGDETAAELRALRVFLQQQQHTQPGAVNAPARTALVEALAPLREVVTALAQAQGEQAARQLALTQELQRWSQLMVETIGGTRADDVKTMAGRLQQLEQAMREQEARHREVETLLQGALDRTADRLEEFLKRLEEGSGTTPANAPAIAPAPPAPKSSDPKAGEPSAVDPPPADPKSAGGDHASPPSTARATGRARGEQWLWLALGVAGFGVGAFFVRRAFRFGRRQYDGVANRAPADDVTHAGQSDPGADEIWAAAALLGETVHRLRQTAGTAAPPGTTASAEAAGAVPDELDLDQVFVLDEFDRTPPANAAAKSEPARVQAAKTPPTNPPGCDFVVCRLAAADLEHARITAARLLADDPRVLRRPAPSLVAKGNRLEVTFATLPGLAAGERSLLAQRLRDAVAPV